MQNYTAIISIQFEKDYDETVKEYSVHKTVDTIEDAYTYWASFMATADKFKSFGKVDYANFYVYTRHDWDNVVHIEFRF